MVDTDHSLPMACRDTIEAALDARHVAANLAFANRDVAAYRDLFGDDLEYVQADGQRIGKARLMKDVAAQFGRIDHAESRFTRESLTIDGHEVSETLRQTARIETSAFGLLRRIFRIERHGMYTWALEGAQWRIVRVRIVQESLESRWMLGR